MEWIHCANFWQVHSERKKKTGTTTKSALQEKTAVSVYFVNENLIIPAK